MSEPNQNDINANEQPTPGAYEQPVLDTSAEPVQAPNQGAYEQPAQEAYAQPAQDQNQYAYGQPGQQPYNPNAQYGYAAPAPGYAPVQNTGESKKVVAGILGILLGSLGIHKFYLGYTVPGVIMLLVSVLTLGLGAIACSIIGLIEGIMYLTMSDEQFNQTYIIGKKEWF